MSSLNALQLDSNSKLKINFDGGDLSSDSGLLLIKEFAHKFGFHKQVKQLFNTRDKAIRFHKDDENLLQLVYQIIAGYFDDDADELTNEPVFTNILGKDSLASQPTLSRFWNRMDDTTLKQFTAIIKSLKAAAYQFDPTKQVLLDLDCNGII